jgi:hypothetical protein
MRISIRCDPAVARDTEEFALRVSDAVTSPVPTLVKEAMAEIARIREARIAALEGSDRFEAGVIFDSLERLPPIEGPRTARLLLGLIGTDFSMAALRAALGELSPTEGSKHPFEQKDELGYCSVAAEMQGPTSIDPVSLELDAQRAMREGFESLARIYRSLVAISDRSTRDALCEDCSRVITQRLRIQL